MKIDVAAVRKSLKSFDFKSLFYEHLGWDKHQAQLDIPVDGNTVSLTAIAQKRGFVAFVCRSMLDRPTRLKIDHQVTKSAREHFVIYADEPSGQQVWHWVRREAGKPLASRDHRFDVSQSGDPLIQRLERIAVSMQEEEALTLPDIAGRNREAFDVDKVTKKFYERFKAEHSAFLKLIKGFPPPVKVDGKLEPHPDLQWYTSLMLNRLMFVYFIQKKGFLDGDTDYLRNRLALVQQARGKDKFQSFYSYFLLRLFHDGLGKSAEERKLDPAMEKLLGRVPYLNGGFFEGHKLETDYPDIEIPDQAFEKLFDFFEYADKANGVRWNWHLDERATRADNEINPDVVGYIFEKYINQKQMGAYYTKEDITEYISKNTIIPYLFDAAQKKCAIAFKPDSALWRLLRDDPDRYIYPAVGHGVTCDYDRINHQDHKRRAAPLSLPAEIEAGVKDVSKREVWSKPAPEGYALPTETWREVIARRQHCLEVREKLRKGEVHEINDLVTLNLDTWQFARDAILNAEGPELLRAFWHAIAGRIPEKSNEKTEPGITILDPTCGSGAFLFAALRILETLYSDCLERMERFIEDIAGKPHHPKQFSDFKSVLDGIGDHRGERYFILKSIIINNLFGVDIMPEAVEICKLRLFLKLVAQVETGEQIEPLPDIDFNIRPGNTLVGFSSAEEVRNAFTQERTGGNVQGTLLLGSAASDYQRFEEDMEIIDRAFQQFRAQQTVHGGRVTAKSKKDLRDRLAKLDAQLDRFLARQYPGDVEEDPEFSGWRATHQPFHWLAEFYGIMQGGGFDVVIGNPPYVATSSVNYLPRTAVALKIPDLYGHVLLRSVAISSQAGRSGMIVPLSITFSEDFGGLRKALTTGNMAWFSSYDNIPAALFAGVSQRCTIWLGARSTAPRIFATQMCRWRSVTRVSLLPTIRYTEIDSDHCSDFGLPKLSSSDLALLLRRLAKPTGSARRATLAVRRNTGCPLGFSQAARNFVSVFIDEPPCLDEKTLKRGVSSKIGYINLCDEPTALAGMASLLGEVYFWYWLTRGDGFDVTGWIVGDFLKCLDYLPDAHMSALSKLGSALHERRLEALAFKKNAGKYVGNYNFRGHAFLTRRADLVLLSGLGAARSTALSVFNHVQRVLAINEFAGEKSIPAAVKAKFRPPPTDQRRETKITAEADALIRAHFDFSDADLEYLLAREVTYGNEVVSEV